jgi:hypothetical protein
MSVFNFVYDNPYMGPVGVQGIKLFALFDQVVYSDLNVVRKKVIAEGSVIVHGVCEMKLF